jgi:hypothetical protein
VQRIALDADEVAQALTEWYDRFRRGESLRTSITREEIASISAQRQVERFAELLHALVEARCSR